MGISVRGAVRGERLRSRVLRIHIPLRRITRLGGKTLGRIRGGVFPNCMLLGVIVGSSA